MKKWINNMLGKTGPKEKPEETINQEFIRVVKELFDNELDPTPFIKEVVFNVKNKPLLSPDTTFTPSELVAKFIAQAEKGENKFLRHYFYRELRKNNDPVVRKIKYILNRNTPNGQ